VKFLCVGDFEGQLRPVNDVGARRRYEESDDLQDLVEGLHIRLTTYRRGTNPRFFEWYCSLYADVPADDAAQSWKERTALANHVVRAGTRHTYSGVLDAVHLVISNDHRQALNEKCNRALKPRDAIFVKSSTGEADFWAYPSLTLAAFHTIGDVAESDGRLKLLHDVLYRIQSIDETEAVLRIDEQYGQGDNFTVTLEELGKHFILAYAVTYYKAQGRTIRDKKVVLWDLIGSRYELHPHITMRHFIMGVQRVTRPEQLCIASPDQHIIFQRGQKRKSEELE
jgi:hypothetical protein